MATSAETTIMAIKDIIVREVKPSQIILFGSHARGTASPDSDIDLLIVEDEPFGPQRSRRKETATIGRKLSTFLVPIDILVFSKDEVEQWRMARNHVIAQALNEGRLLYART